MILLDASAVLALLWQEAGAERVAQSLTDAGICSVNLAEVTAKMSDRGIPPETVRAILAGLDLQEITFSAGAAIRSGELRAETKSLGLSLGARACIACAEDIEAEVVLTADRSWRNLSITGVCVECLR